MIVPSNRLIYSTGLVVLPLAVVVAVDPSTHILAAAICGLFLLLVAADAVASLNRLGSVEAGFSEVTRLTKDREGEIHINIENEPARRQRLRLGIVIPKGISSPHETIETTVNEETKKARVSWPCTGLVRGRYVLENIYLEKSSHLGFWGIRKVSRTRGEVRVFPNIFHEQKNLAALFLNRVGLNPQRQVGKGKDFEKLREYMPGDDYGDIHWKATAKRGRPITKIFQIERTQELYIAVDASRLSARTVSAPTRGPATTQLERFITAALVMGLVTDIQGDLFGLFAFDDKVCRFIRANRGKGHYSACRDALYTLQPQRVNPDFGEVFSFIRRRLRRRALLIFLTNLDDPVLAESFVSNLDVLTRRHLILVNILTLPGVAPLFSDPEVSEVDDLYGKLGGHIQWQKLRELEKVLKRRGVPLGMLDNEMLCPQLVSQYLGVKRRQIL